LFVTAEQLKGYIETFLGYFNLLTNLFNRENADRIFPKFFRFPYRTNGTISTVHGVSIEFLEESNDYNIKIGIVNEPIEDAILPQTSPNKVAIYIKPNARFIDIEGAGFVTKEFHETRDNNRLYGITEIKELSFSSAPPFNRSSYEL